MTKEMKSTIETNLGELRFAPVELDIKFLDSSEVNDFLAAITEFKKTPSLPMFRSQHDYEDDDEDDDDDDDDDEEENLGVIMNRILIKVRDHLRKSRTRKDRMRKGPKNMHDRFISYSVVTEPLGFEPFKLGVVVNTPRLFKELCDDVNKILIGAISYSVIMLNLKEVLDSIKVNEK